MQNSSLWRPVVQAKHAVGRLLEDGHWQGLRRGTAVQLRNLKLSWQPWLRLPCAAGEPLTPVQCMSLF